MEFTYYEERAPDVDLSKIKEGKYLNTMGLTDWWIQVKEDILCKCNYTYEISHYSQIN